jgi:hypothetical protein
MVGEERCGETKNIKQTVGSRKEKKRGAEIKESETTAARISVFFFSRFFL